MDQLKGVDLALLLKEQKNSHYLIANAVHLLILHVICSKSGVDQVVRVN
jgi:hypothetical protein